MHNPQDNSLLVINMAERSVYAVSVRPPAWMTTKNTVYGLTMGCGTRRGAQIPQFTNYKLSVMLTDLSKTGVLGSFHHQPLPADAKPFLTAPPPTRPNSVPIHPPNPAHAS